MSATVSRARPPKKTKAESLSSSGLPSPNARSLAGIQADYAQQVSPIDLQNLRERVLSDDGDRISARDLLILLLSRSIYVDEAAKAAAILMSTFKSVGAVFAADPKEIQSVLPDHPECASILHAARRLTLMVLREPFEEGSDLGDFANLYDYLDLSLAHEKTEVVRLLLLDGRNRLIKDELVARGWRGGVSIQPRDIVQRALDIQARAVIIVHNHPSGDPTPSKEDAEMTRAIAQVLSLLQISLHDHIIVGRGGCVSMYLRGLL